MNSSRLKMRYRSGTERLAAFSGDHDLGAPVVRTAMLDQAALLHPSQVREAAFSRSAASWRAEPVAVGPAEASST